MVTSVDIKELRIRAQSMPEAALLDEVCHLALEALRRRALEDEHELRLAQAHHAQQLLNANEMNQHVRKEAHRQATERLLAFYERK